MTSSSIHSSILACDTQIESLRASISRLKSKINEQEHALRSFQPLKDQYIEEFSARLWRTEHVKGFVTISVFSERFQAKANEAIDYSKGSFVYDNLGAIDQKCATRSITSTRH